MFTLFPASFWYTVVSASFLSMCFGLYVAHRLAKASTQNRQILKQRPFFRTFITYYSYIMYAGHFITMSLVVLMGVVFYQFVLPVDETTVYYYQYIKIAGGALIFMQVFKTLAAATMFYGLITDKS